MFVRGVQVVGERAALPIEATQPAGESSHPNVAMAVEKQRLDAIVPQTLRTAGVVPEVLEGLCLRIKSIESAAPRTDPDEAVTVDDDRAGVVLRQRCRILGIVLKDLESIAIKAVDAVLRGEPEESGLVLRQTIDRGVRQSF